MSLPRIAQAAGAVDDGVSSFKSGLPDTSVVSRPKSTKTAWAPARFDDGRTAGHDFVAGNSQGCRNLPPHKSSSTRYEHAQIAPSHTFNLHAAKAAIP